MEFVKDIFVLIIGFVVGYWFGRKGAANGRHGFKREKKKSLDEVRDKERKDAEKKKENLEKVRAFIGEKEKVANDDIEKLLGVSDATATRYLEDLEKEGFIRQVGKTGQHVYYEKVGQ